MAFFIENETLYLGEQNNTYSVGRVMNPLLHAGFMIKVSYKDP